MRARTWTAKFGTTGTTLTTRRFTPTAGVPWSGTRTATKAQKGILYLTDYNRWLLCAPAVLAYLNIFKLPQKYQEYIWNEKIGVKDVMILGPMLNEGVKGLTRAIEWLDTKLERKLSSEELEKAVKPEMADFEEKRVEAAQKAVAKLECAPTVVYTTVYNSVGVTGCWYG